MTTIYKEPTYHLHLTPQASPQAHALKSVGQKSRPYQNLDHLVDQAMQNRYDNELENFSEKKVKKLRKQIAYSLMERPDQKSAMKIQLPLAKAHGLVQNIKERLESHIQPTKVDLSELAEFVFSDCKEDNFGMILSVKLNSLLGRKNKPEKEKLFKEVCKIRDELESLTSATMKYYRPSQLTDGLSYIDHQGKTVTLAQTIPSSYDRDHPDVQNGRFNLDSNQRVIYSTGRIETERKALQVLYRVIHQTFISGQINTADLVKHEDGSYLYPVVVENLIGTSSIAKKERELLNQENETLKSLSGSNLTVTLPTGEKVVVKLKLMHFSTQTNFNVFLGQRHGWSTTGSDLAEEITVEGTDSLKEYFDLIKTNLPEGTQKAVQFCLDKLDTCTKLRDRLIYRAFICELLNIPYHVHCKSSKDRTAVVAAIKKALHQWLRIEQWKGKLEIPDPAEFFNSSVFKEYSEAAFFENLTMTDQGVGINGVLDGKLHTQDRGFNYRKSIAEHPFPAFALTDRHLYTASLLERVIKATLWATASLVLTTVYVALFPVFLGILLLVYGKDCLKVAGYIFLALLALPARSGFRRQWLDHDSKTLKERNFFLKHNSKKPFSSEQKPLSLNQLNQAVEKLSEQNYQKLLNFLQTSDPMHIEVIKIVEGEQKNCPDENAAYLLRELANHWEKLKTAKNSARMQGLIDAASKSTVTLFQLLEQTNSDQVKQFTIDTDLKHATDEFLPTLDREKSGTFDGLPITIMFGKDFARTNIVVKTPEGEIAFKDNKRSLHRLREFFEALKKIPLLKNEKTIPLAIEEMVTQKTTLFTSLIKYMHTIDSTINLGTPDSRIFTIEQGQGSTLVLRLFESSPIYSKDDPSITIGKVQWQCEFHLDGNQNWEATLENVSQVEFKWNDVSELLLESEHIEKDTMIQRTKVSNNIELLRKYVSAIAELKDEDNVDPLTKNIPPLIEAIKSAKLSEEQLKETEFEHNVAKMKESYEKCQNVQNKKIINGILEELAVTKT